MVIVKNNLSWATLRNDRRAWLVISKISLERNYPETNNFRKLHVLLAISSKHSVQFRIKEDILKCRALVRDKASTTRFTGELTVVTDLGFSNMCLVLSTRLIR